MTSMDLLLRLKTATQMAMSPGNHITDILHHLLLSIEDAILIGLAEKIDDETFCVAHVVGEGSDQLKDLEFCVGEGYLGHVVATEQPGYWSNVSNDPRTAWFTRNGIYPISVFCHPIFQGQKVTGVLFGALSAEAKDDALTFLELISIVLGRQMRIDTLDKNLQVRTVRLAVLIELSQAIREVEDVRNVFYVILDMSINLVQGPFACIAFQRAHQDSAVELITRGIPRPQAEKYGRELVNSYFGRTTADFKDHNVSDIRTLEKTPVIECPLFVENKVIAVLAVAVDEKSSLDEFTQLIYVLSVIGGAALQRIYQEKAHDWMREISLIHQASAVWAMEAHDHALKVQELAMGFAKKLGWSDVAIRNVSQAALLTPCTMMFVQKALPELPAPIYQALYDYRRIIETDTTDSAPPSEMGRILALIEAHLGHVDISIKCVADELCEKFRQFLLQKRIEIQQIELHGMQKSTLIDVLTLSSLPIEEPLTAREQEVLQLLVTGKGNKEIAQILFISEHTVKNHMTNIFQKLGVADRTQAVAFVLGQLK